ncbi:receptor-like serine/threonine-protein kinase At4g25390 [Neltuma alba]|uniref:receptor-like serine/threonine-protein kinase At4g25390 n=1 Tax=Neltuma alba TaxID=207710 RepID=UPI0010A55697|nr:receptor-like serine/threonine-protein kinase At4g25390 [Prosopis alba]
MPSRRFSTSPPSEVVAVDPYPPCSLFFLAFLCFRRRTRKRTTPSSDSESKPPHRFSYSSIRLATASFSTRIGHGGFGPVFSGVLPPTRKPIAVKLMDSASIQGEREFHNELFFASKLCSPHVVVAIGSASDRSHRRFLLVYDLMPNGNLHDALLRRKSLELMNWKKRFAIIIDIAKGIRYLHSCDPPVIHGDIKPSNILLDSSFSAKIADFGLARLKSESQYDFDIFSGIDYSGSVVEETGSVNTGFEEQTVSMVETSPETDFPAKENCDRGKKNAERLKSRSMKDWWRKEDDDKKKSKKQFEWWREEYREKLEKKNKEKGFYSDEEAFDREMKKNKRRGRSIDWWFDGISRNSHDSFSGEIHNPKSGGISSTPSLKGTVCYAAPEYSHGGEITEKCDVYSFGVLLLVIVSGRRPIEMVSGSPLSELQRGNLLYWARHCARNGKLVELADQNMCMKLPEKEEAILCIKVALLCLVKSPSRRPSMEEVVRMLGGDMEPPQLPTEYSSSSPSPFPLKSGKNAH